MTKINKDVESSGESYAYTPGLKIKSSMTITKYRRLPVKGEILVKEGDEVSFDDVVGRAIVPGDPYTIKATDLLNVEPKEISDFIVKKAGDPVKKDEPVAVYKILLGLSKRYAKSPVDGIVETMSDITGQVIVRSNPIPVIVKAYIPGKVCKVVPGEGAVIETRAAFIQGIFGLGGETHGEIKLAVSSPDQSLVPDLITEEHKGRILVGGSDVSYEAIEKAVHIGVAGIVSGGIDQDDLKKFYGQQIGVAITGEEELGLTLIITEGFGRMSMSQKSFELIRRFERSIASINGTTQIRAGVIRPEIVIPHEQTPEQSITTEKRDAGMMPGTSVRIIRDPYFGAIGKIDSLPVELQIVETGAKVRVASVRLEDGTLAIVPRANVEIIEE